jgi:hypothetical protein
MRLFENSGSTAGIQHPMQAIEQALLAFFEHVARKDAKQVGRLKDDPRFCVEEERWCFRLRDLYAFLQDQEAVFRSVTYKQFRHLLFKSPINQTARASGAEIVIADNRAKVDESTYALIWQPARRADPATPE